MATKLRVLPEEPELSVVKEKIRSILPKLDEDKKMMVLKKFIKTPDFDYRILLRLCLEELEATKNKPAEVEKPQKPTILRIKLSSTAATSSTSSNPDNNVIHNQDSTRFSSTLECSETNDGFDGVQQGNSPDMPPKLRQLLKREGGYNPVLVIQKRLFASDVKLCLGRLSLPINQLNPRFLTEEERKKLSSPTNLEKIEAKMFEPSGEECTIKLAKWNMGSEIYSLNKTWNDVVKRNRLEEGMEVQLWSFRVGLQLCFFLFRG